MLCSNPHFTDEKIKPRPDQLGDLPELSNKARQDQQRRRRRSGPSRPLWAQIPSPGCPLSAQTVPPVFGPGGLLQCTHRLLCLRWFPKSPEPEGHCRIVGVVTAVAQSQNEPCDDKWAAHCGWDPTAIKCPGPQPPQGEASVLKSKIQIIINLAAVSKS